MSKCSRSHNKTCHCEQSEAICINLVHDKQIISPFRKRLVMTKIEKYQTEKCKTEKYKTSN